MKKRKIFEKGFTLVELLIVIALIAILSVAVLATINPIEQTNKARDAKFRNDAAEVLAALERYYASQNAYPWNTGVGETIAGAVDPGTEIALVSNTELFGVRHGDEPGVLISTSELKSSFTGKEPFQSDATSIDLMYMYHNGSDSNYVCFVPKARANRYTGSGPNPALKCINVASGVNAALIDQSSTCVAPTEWDESSADPSATVANLLCVPEGMLGVVGVGGT